MTAGAAAAGSQEWEEGDDYDEGLTDGMLGWLLDQQLRIMSVRQVQEIAGPVDMAPMPQPAPAADAGAHARSAAATAATVNAPLDPAVTEPGPAATSAAAAAAAGLVQPMQALSTSGAVAQPGGTSAPLPDVPPAPAAVEGVEVGGRVRASKRKAVGSPE